MNIDIRILKVLYAKKYDGNYFDVSKYLPVKFLKDKIDDTVIALDEKGYIDKKFKGYISKSMLSSSDDPEHANNSICRINPTGITYYENYVNQIKSNKISSIALIIAVISMVISALAFYHK